MKSRIRMSLQTLRLLDALLLRPSEWHYGYDLSRATGLKSGTLYPILMRLKKHRWLEAHWETPQQPGRPSRHVYRLTSQGLELASQALREVQSRRATQEFAPQGPGR